MHKVTQTNVAPQFLGSSQVLNIYFMFPGKNDSEKKILF